MRYLRATLSSAWKWIRGHVVTTSLIVVVFALVVTYFLIGRKSIGLLAADIIEGAHRPRIKQLHQDIEELRKNLGKNLNEIAKKEAKLDELQEDLELVYTTVGLSVEERRERYSRVSK